MKKSLLGLAVLLFAASCNSEEKEAQQRLNQAQELVHENKLFAAKQEIDSVRILYPKLVNIQKQSLHLMRQVEFKEAERNLAYCDSLLPIRQAECEKLIKDFVYEKDSVYDEIGKFIWKQQTIERNLQRCYIRAGVNEKGEMYIASVYYGKNPIGHTSVRFSTPDDLFAETPVVAYDGGNNYRFEDLGMKTEVVTYKGIEAADAINFIYSIPQKERIKVEYKGDKPYIIYLADPDRKAIRATYELATVLNDIERMNKQIAKSQQKLAYLSGKLNQQKNTGKE